MGGVTLDRDGAVAVITIDRPDKLNALTLAMYDQLGEAFDEVRDDASIGVAILTGAGERSFCVGADFEESIPALTEGRFEISEWDGAHQKHSRLEKPVIAAIDGLCLGGGFEIMLSTDIRIVSTTASFALPETGGRRRPCWWDSCATHPTDSLRLRNGSDAARQPDRRGHRRALRPDQQGRRSCELVDTARTVAEELLGKSRTAMATVKRAVRELADLPEERLFVGRPSSVNGPSTVTMRRARARRVRAAADPLVSVELVPS